MGITGTERDIMPLTNRASTRSLPVSEVLLGSVALLNHCHPTKSRDLQVYMERSLFFPVTVQSSWWQWRQHSRHPVYFAASLCGGNCVCPHQWTERRRVGQTTLPVINVFIQGSKRFAARSCCWWKAALCRSRCSVAQAEGHRSYTHTQCVTAGNKVEDPPQ